MNWVMRYLARHNVGQTLATPQNQMSNGLTSESQRETSAYTIRHTIEDGIERIVYIPKQRRFETPLLLVHGIWHGAWCWQFWQELFAAWGWESVAFSQPGHAGSPEQRTIRLCTLDYYLAFVKSEVERPPRQPVMIGHSMGGALTQWYLKHVGDDLPASVSSVVSAVRWA
jgi:pimeloyl-ACP methyl ester carboxylesterase